MADRAEIKTATGSSRDGITGDLIPKGTPVAHVTINSRCAPFFTAAGLRRLADEIEKGTGLLFYSNGPAKDERWPECGWIAKHAAHLQARAEHAAHLQAREPTRDTLHPDGL